MDPTKWKLYESALIKSIRRSKVDDAIYWGVLLDKLGYAEDVWRRLFIHLSEDIGLNDLNMPANIEALYANYKRLKEPGKTAYEAENIQRLPYVHAIMLMATAKKSRYVDHAQAYHYNSAEERTVPDYAIDYHSPLGRRMGRDLNHFRQEAAKLQNPQEYGLTDRQIVIEDIWEDKAYKILKEKRSE